MYIYTIVDFEGHWPVGTSAVVVAKGRRNAARLLNEALERDGLPGTVKPEELKLLDTQVSKAYILQNGDY